MKAQGGGGDGLIPEAALCVVLRASGGSEHPLDTQGFLNSTRMTNDIGRVECRGAENVLNPACSLLPQRSCFLSIEFSLGGKFKHLLSSRLTEPVFKVYICTQVHIQAQIQIMLTCAHVATQTYTCDVCCVCTSPHTFFLDLVCTPRICATYFSSILCMHHTHNF